MKCLGKKPPKYGCVAIINHQRKALLEAAQIIEDMSGWHFRGKEFARKLRISAGEPDV